MVRSRIGRIAQQLLQFAKVQGRSQKHTGRRPRRLQLESMEARRLMATLASSSSIRNVFQVAEDAILSESLFPSDSHASGNELAAILIDSPTLGSITLNEDGTFLYVPDPD